MLYLSAAAPAHDGPESLLEFLNRMGPFIPATLQAGDSVLVARDAIRCAIAAADAASRAEEGMPTLDLVHVQLDDGLEIEGVVRHTATGDRSRLSYHFNDADRFVAIESGEMIHYVHKQHVLFVS